MILGIEKQDEGHGIVENLESRKGEDLWNWWINKKNFILHWL